MRNTLLLAIGTGAVSIPPGALLAWLCFRTDLPGRQAATALLMGLLFLPLYLQAAAWDAGFGSQGWFYIADPAWGAWALLSGWRGAIWVHAVAAVPWVVLIVGSALRNVASELEDATLLDASALRVFCRVTAPAAGSAILIAVLWVLVVTANEMTVTDIYQVRTFAEDIYAGFALDPPQAGAWLGPSRTTVWVGILLIAWLTGAAALICHCYRPPATPPATTQPPRDFSLGIWRWPAAALVALILLMLVGVPLANLAYKAGVVVEQIGPQRVRTWSLFKALNLVLASPHKFRAEIGWSLSLAHLAALSAVCLSLPLTWATRRRRTASVVVTLLAAVGFAVPGPLIGIALARAFTVTDNPLLAYFYDQTIAAPWLALTIRCLPLVLLIEWHAFQSIPAEIVEAARVAGAGWWQQLFWIGVRERWPALLLAWLIGLAIGLADLAATILVVPPGVTTLSIRIFGLVHYGVEDYLASICLAMWLVFLVISVGMIALAAVIRRRHVVNVSTC